MRIFRSQEEDLRDLGFGSVVAEQSHHRLLNQDGSFNVVRRGLSFFESIHWFHSLLTMPWWRFYLTITVIYVLVNVLFASVFVTVGESAVTGDAGLALKERFWTAFFFSVQTFTTLGYGHLTPHGMPGNIIASADVFVGLILFAVATGLLFARFSRPTSKILFSRVALIAPYRSMTGFVFRVANARSNQLVELQVKVVYSAQCDLDGTKRRIFQRLTLERPKVAFFPLHLTAVHPIDEQSPLHGMTSKDLTEADAEFLILITAFDETFSQTVHSRSSYKHHELVWGAQFKSMFKDSSDGMISVDLRSLHDFAMVAETGENRH